MDAHEHLSLGIAAHQAGDLRRARQHLASAVQQDSSLVEAWWGLAQLLEDPAQRREALRRVLALEPHHTGASALLAKETAGAPPAPPAAPGGTWPPASVAVGRPPQPTAETAPRRPARPASRRTYLIAAGVFLGILLIGGGGLAALLLSGAADSLLGRPAAAPSAGGPAAAIPTLPPEWTATPSPMPSPTQPSATPALTLESTPGLAAGPDPRFTGAMRSMEAGNFDLAITQWTSLLEDDPGNHAAYYQRAFAHLRLTQGLGFLDQYIAHSQAAIADTDQAIALSPGPVGDYYMARTWGYENLAGVAENRVDQDRLAEVALDNYLIGQELPTRNPLLTGPASLFIRLGRCQEALQAAQQKERERGQGLAPSPRNHYDLATSYICLGRFQQGLDEIEIALAAYRDISYRYQRAVALYHLGRKSDALAELTSSLTSSPDRDGYRYYLRALIEYELGATAKSEADLIIGSFNTWTQDGMKAYVEARMLLDRGQRQRGVERLQQAEMTIDRSHGPFVERLRRELAALGAQPLSPTAQPGPQSTPIPALPADHPTPLPQHQVLHGHGLGPYTLQPHEELLIHFAPPAGFTWIDIVRAFANVLAVDASQSSDLEMFVHNPSRQWWDRFDVTAGPISIPSPEQYFYASGSCFVKVHNLSGQPVTLVNVGLNVEVVDRDGFRQRYNFQAG